MKGKTLLSLAIVLSMILAVLPMFGVEAADPVKVEVVFENGLNEITKAPCSNFNVDIKVTLPSGVAIDFWALEIRWDPTVLELQTGTSADVIEGPFMNAFGGTVFVCAEPDNTAGILPDIGCGFLTGGPATGSGVIVTIKFHCKAPGDGNIIIYQPNAESYLLLGATMVNIDEAVNGIVHQPAPPATPPNAEFTPEDGTFVEVSTDVILDAGASTPGYDTLPSPGHECPITMYQWDIDVGNDGTIDFTLFGVTASFHCDGPGPVGITLTVIAPDLIPPTAASYVDTNSEKHVIMQVMPPVGPAIDVYTIVDCTPPYEVYGGLGPGGAYPFGWSDAYGPQQEVCVAAKVTYNDEPVEYKPVAFEIIDPSCVARDYRSNFTDANGIAIVCFRIPWEGSNAEDLFGNWSVVGTVSISEVIVTDTVYFRFGYILSIRNIIVTGSPLRKLETMTIDVDIQSISMSSREAFMTIVACDECGVPIGLATGDITVDPEDGKETDYTITIPKWAFVGTGTIYVNLFTDPPSAGGVPYCPEETSFFIILKTP